MLSQTACNCKESSCIICHSRGNSKTPRSTMLKSLRFIVKVVPSAHIVKLHCKTGTPEQVHGPYGLRNDLDGEGEYKDHMENGHHSFLHSVVFLKYFTK